MHFLSVQAAEQTPQMERPLDWPGDLEVANYRSDMICDMSFIYNPRDQPQNIRQKALLDLELCSVCTSRLELQIQGCPGFIYKIKIYPSNNSRTKDHQFPIGQTADLAHFDNSIS